MTRKLTLPITKAAILLILLILVEQLIKIFVCNHLILNQPYHIWSGLYLYYTHNEGISFSLFSGLPSYSLFIAASLITIVFIIIWFKTPAENYLLKYGSLFIIAGAISNLIDRGMLGYVIDYIAIVWGNFNSPIFNLADIYIDIGVGLILYNALFQKSTKA